MRDYFKEQLAARMRQLFAAKSEARGLAQSDLFFNLSGTDSPPLAA